MDKSIQRAGNPNVPPLAPRTMPMPPVAMMGAMGGSGLTPKEVVGIIRRHIWMIILLTLLGLMVGGGAWALLRRTMPRYTALAHIEVLAPIDQDPTQISPVQPNRDIYYQFRATKAAQMMEQNMLQDLLRNETIRNTNWYKQFVKVDQSGSANETEAVRNALDNLKRNFRVSAPRDLTVLIVSMRCAEAREAKTIVDTAIRLFLTQQREQARRDISAELAERRDQRDSIRRALNTIEQTLDSIRAGTRFARLNVSRTSNFRDYMDEKLADIEDRFSQYDSHRAYLESTIEILRHRATSPEFDEVVREQIENDPIARQMRANIAAMEPVLERQLARFGEDHRTVKETRAALEQMRADLVYRQNEIAEIFRQSDYRNAQDQMTALTQQLDTVMQQLQQAQNEYKEADKVRAEYARYEIQREEQQRLLEEMNTLIEKLNAMYSDPTIHKMRAAGLAAEPLEVSFPRWELFFPGGFILGLLVGLGLAFAVEMLNDLLRTPTDVVRHVKVPLMGMVYHADEDEDIEDVDIYHVVRQAPYSITSECYRQLRTNLKLSGEGGKPHQTLFITSPAAGDGKTTVAVNMAGSFLMEGKRVLLIDANFRRPMSNRLFPPSGAASTEQQADYGLSNYLMGQCTDENQIIRSTDMQGLFVIDSGPLPSNPSELLSSERMTHLLERCKEQFDYVIIDGPAMLVSDAKTLAALADGTIVVFNAETTHRGEALRILRELRHVNANTIGTVLLGVRSRKGGYFREVYRSYQDYQRAAARQPV